MTVANAAKKLHMNPTQVRVLMQRGKLPIGTCYKGTGDRYVYKVFDAWLEQYISGEVRR